MIHLRRTAGYIEFRETFDAIAASADQLAEVRKVFVLAAEVSKPAPGFLSMVSRNCGPIVPAYGVVLPEQEIEEIAQRLAWVAVRASEIVQQLKAVETMVKTERRSRLVYSAKQKEVAIFVALEMERKVLIESWGLKAVGREQVWRGQLQNVRISVFSRDEMGRVPAAVATMQLLSQGKPDLLLVAGIAGGFEQEGVSLGNILIPPDIVDLASRKIKMYGDARTILEFRPREFRTDDRLANYLKASFESSEWQSKVIKVAEWPDHRRPAIQYGPIASLDEVVADTNFVSELLTAWPKLLGIEMEAGGVCAAAETFGMKPAVIRCVSDLADPSKSDNEWRRRAMKTVTHLIESLDFDVLLAD